MDEKIRNQLRSQIQLSARHLQGGDRAEAGRLYDEVSDKAGDDVVLNAELGHLCLLFGANDKAAHHYLLAVQGAPDNGSYLGFLGVSKLRCGEPDQARTLLERARVLEPENPQVINGLGMVCYEQADYAEARCFFEQARKLLPKDIQIMINLARTLVELNDHSLSLELAKNVTRIDPSNPVAQGLIGRILAETGRTDEAVRHFEKMLSQRGNHGVAFDNLARLKKFSTQDQALINKAEKSLSQGMPPRDRLRVHYALGKMYDDCNEYSKAFAHYQQANLLQKCPFDINNDRRWFKQQTRAFTRKSIQAYSTNGHSSAQPVFIVGMPRTGTTLLERIIASHSCAAGAGELPTLPGIAHRILDEKERAPAIAVKKTLTREYQQALAREYLQILGRGHDGKQRVVDKLPGNYQHLGVIASLFPNATIIHIKRNPLDTCLSCYFQAFGQVSWANELSSIADVYRLYRDYMEHWSTALPAGKILDVQYESLIENPETEARRVIAHCGLEWEPHILQFHATEGVVRTVSQWQVRQPIYKTSSRRWVSYAGQEQVVELANQLADYLVHEREVLTSHGIALESSRGFGWFNFG